MTHCYATKFSIKKSLARKGTLRINNLSFTSREWDVLSCMLSGRSFKAIAALLSLSPKTVETHSRNIFQKMQINSREEAINQMENSPAYASLKNHYLNILIPLDKRKCLEELQPYFKNPAQDPIIIGLDTGSLLLAGELKRDFDRLKFKATVERATSFASKNEQNPKSVFIYIFSVEEKLENPQDFKNNNQFGLVVSTTPLSQEKIQKAVEGGENVPYEIAVLGILKSLVNNEDVRAIIEGVLKKHSGNIHDLLDYSEGHTPKTSATHSLAKPSILLGIIIGIFIPVIALFFIHASSLKPSISNLYLISKNKLLMRKDLGSTIETILNHQKDSQQNPIAIILGIGGSGKTTLARLYGKSKNSPLIWEINAQSLSSIVQSFETLANHLSESNEDLRQDYERIMDNFVGQEKALNLINLVKRFLKNHPGWILIYDDMKEDYGKIKTHILRDVSTVGKGQIIITTRDANIKLVLPKEIILDMAPLSLLEKIELFKKSYGEDAIKSLNRECSRNCVK